MAEQYAVGIDFGTLSGRAVVVRVRDGAELGSAVHDYPNGVREDGLTALQVPADYLEVLRHVVPEALRQSGVDPQDVIGIGTDFTACTVLPTTEDGTPLSELHPDEPHAYVKLWKHHAAQPQADRINALAAERGEPWLKRYGGLISSEWEFAKALEVLEEAPHIYREMRYWAEAADWIVWQLTGTYVRNACTAGYKGMYQDGYPSREFLKALNPAFEHFATEKLDRPLAPLGSSAGGLTAEAATWTGLREGTPVAVGNIDAHVTVPAANARENQLVAIMGTSTCHVMSSRELRELPGMCGVVDGGIVAGQWGYEAGQSGVGDIFAWFVDHCVPGEYHERAHDEGISVHELLTRLAEQARDHGLIALDWHSGNRSVLVDHRLSGVVVGQTLATRAEHTYRALMEATAFGTRVIVEAFRDAGLPVTELIVAGGLVRNPLLMQIYADVLDLPLSVTGSEQAAALGAAIHGAVAAGAYPDVPAAANRMGSVTRGVYQPITENVQHYQRLYAEYVELHDYFGRGGNDVMRRLRALGGR